MELGNGMFYNVISYLQREAVMATYIVETNNNKKKYQKNYGLPLINIIPAVIWSIPLHQKLFPDATFWITLGLCGLFVVLYVFLSFSPVISAIPCVASVVMLTAMFWVFPDAIENAVVRIIIKIIILAIAIFIEIGIFANATVPWLEAKAANKPRIIVKK